MFDRTPFLSGRFGPRWLCALVCLVGALMVLVLPSVAGAAVVKAGTFDGADAPASPLDIDQIRAEYDAEAGAMTIVFRLHGPFPDALGQGAYIDADLKQGVAYTSECASGTTPGDVTLRMTATGMGYGSTVAIFGVSATPVVAQTFSADRREVAVSFSHQALTSRTYFCLSGRSSAGTGVVTDRRFDDTPTAFFAPFEPAPPVLISPVVGTVARGAPPQLVWDDRLSTDEKLLLYNADPASGASPIVTFSKSGYSQGTNALAAFSTLTTALKREAGQATLNFTSGLTSHRLPFGAYWWAVQRDFGKHATLTSSTGQFEMGPPELKSVELSTEVEQPPSHRGRGRAQVSVQAAELGYGLITIWRAGRIVTRKAVAIKRDEDEELTEPSVSVRLSCARPGAYLAIARMQDRYGTVITRRARWTVSSKRCARMLAKHRRKLAAERRAKERKRKQQKGASKSCTPGYSPCLPRGSDLDCDEIPASKKPVRVTGSDPYRLDADNDGVGCE